MKVEKRPNGWWITEVPPYYVDGELCTDYGPYDTKSDAEDSRRCVQRTLDSMDKNDGTLPRL